MSDITKMEEAWRAAREAWIAARAATLDAEKVVNAARHSEADAWRKLKTAALALPHKRFRRGLTCPDCGPTCPRCGQAMGRWDTIHYGCPTKEADDVPTLA